MKRVAYLSLSVLTLLCFAFLQGQAQKSNSSWNIKWETSKVFIENKGQFPLLNKDEIKSSDVLYAFDNGQSITYFTKTGVIYAFNKVSPRYAESVIEEEKDNSTTKNYAEKEKEERSIKISPDIKYMKWENANHDVEIVSSEATSDYFSYSYYDKDRNVKNINFLKGYKKITYKNLYPNIDVEFTFHPTDGIKYSLILHPGADISKVKMNYSDNVKLNSSGDIHIQTLFGEIIEHAPVTFYAENKSSIIKSSFVKTRNTISFKLDNYDSTKTVIIDPWVVTSNFTTSTAVWEVETDGSGNVYVIGGETPMQLKKYNSAGAPQWTYTTPWDTASVWLGTLATDNLGNSFITSGTAPAMQRVDNAGNFVWQSTGNAASDEWWSITFNCDKTKLIIGGTVLNMLTFEANATIFNMDITNGSVLSTQYVDTNNIAGIGTNPIEVRSISSSKNAKYIFLTHHEVGAINQNIGLCPTNTPIFQVDNGHHLGYKCEDYLPAHQNGGGLKALVANDQYFYVNNGNTIDQRALVDGSLISSATIPGGVSSTDIFGNLVVSNSGLAVDDCGNVYAGSANCVAKYDANLNLLAQPAVTFCVYDVSVNSNGEVIAVGAQSNNQSTIRNGKIESIALSACAQFSLVCCDANICPVTAFCTTDAPTNLSAATSGGTWSGPGITNATAGTFDPSVAGAGTHYIVYTLPCGSDSVKIIVTACLTLSACTETNGDITVSGGISPYTWEVGHGSTDCSSCPLGQCMPPICNGVFVTTYTNFATGTTVTPQSLNDTIRITDANSNTITITNISSLPDCPICPPMNISSNFTNVNCWGYSTGSITATPPGSALYNYTLLNGVGTTVATLTNVTGAQNFTNLPAGTYNLIVADTGSCDTTIIVTISQPQSVNQVYTIQNEVCENSCLGSIALNITGGSPPFIFNWSNGATTQNLSNVCSDPYTVTITDANGCTFDSTLNVTYAIAASFTAVPPIGAPPLGVTFTYTGTAGIGYLWNFGDGTPTDTTENPIHIYTAPGTYNVSMIVYLDSASSCTVTFTVVVQTPSFMIIPNVFTPNADGFNDNFIIKNAGLESFSCVIFNRWGKNVYEWTDPSKGWDGKTSAGTALQDGVYYYIITAKGLDGIDYSEHGTVTLMRH
jgi:gliding motility-associated-like protein